MRELSGVIEALGEASYEVLPPDPLTKVTSALLAGGIVELLVAWIDGSIEVSEEQLIGDAAALVVGLGDAAAAIGAARMLSRPATRER